MIACRAPDARDVCRCERPRGHDGQHAVTEDGRAFRWGRASGPSRPHAERQAAGGVRVDLYVPAEAARDLEAITGPEGRTAAIVGAIRAAAARVRRRLAARATR